MDFSGLAPLVEAGDTSAAAPNAVPTIPPTTAPIGPPMIAPTTAPEAPSWVFLLNESDESDAALLGFEVERFFMGSEVLDYRVRRMPAVPPRSR